MVGAVTLGAERYDVSAADESSIHLAGLYCETKLAQLASSRAARGAMLTQRERECLRWVAAGKTDWEMSCILGISQKTAQEHVGKAVAKLNAATRSHAVAIALAGNQIAM